MRATSNWTHVHARFRPDAEALVDAGTGRRWSWRELHAHTLSMAGFLRMQGVRRGDRVGVLAPNRGETLVALMACAELGAVLFPLNWRLSPAEMAWQVGHAEPAVLLTDPSLEGAAGGLGTTALPMDAYLGCEPFEGPGAELDEAWVLMYTSGSSGRPKGALLTHGQLHWNALNTILACDLCPADSTLTFAPLFHTGGLNCLTTPLLHRGGRVVVVPRLDAGAVLTLIASERITLLMGVPTIYQVLADHPDFHVADLSSVRDALCGGAPLSHALLERYLDRALPLRQGFGLTEVGPNCFSTPPHQVRARLGTVGMPTPHVAARLVRPDGAECGPGEVGELLLSGPAVFGGYWRDPEATSRAFQDGWFRTGDVMAADADGFLSVRGRLKEMFISGGENVYPAEVEAALLDCPGVAAAAVIGVADSRWGEVGVAFLEPAPGYELIPERVTAFLEGRLARFKRPKSIHLHRALPRTGSGKIDKPALTRLLES